MSTPGVFPGSKGGRCVRLTTLPPSCAVVMKSGSLNFLQPSGPLQACKGTALPLLPQAHVECGRSCVCLLVFLYVWQDEYIPNWKLCFKLCRPQLCCMRPHWLVLCEGSRCLSVQISCCFSHSYLNTVLSCNQNVRTLPCKNEVT